MLYLLFETELFSCIAVLAASRTDSEDTGDLISNLHLEITTEDVAIEMKTSSVHR